MDSEKIKINPNKIISGLVFVLILSFIWMIPAGNIQAIHNSKSAKELIVTIIIMNTAYLIALIILYFGLKKLLRNKIVIEDGIISYKGFDFGESVKFDLRKVVSTSFFRHGHYFVVGSVMLTLDSNDKYFIHTTFIGNKKLLYKTIEKYAKVSPFDEIKRKANN